MPPVNKDPDWLSQRQAVKMLGFTSPYLLLRLAVQGKIRTKDVMGWVKYSREDLEIELMSILDRPAQEVKAKAVEIKRHQAAEPGVDILELLMKGEGDGG